MSDIDKPLQEFRDLWEEGASDYLLVDMDADAYKQLGSRYLIFNVIHQSAEIIEDEAIVDEVVTRMIQAGVQIVSEIPTE